MSGEKLLNAIGEIDDVYIAEAAEERTGARRVWVRWAALAACLALVLALSLPWLGGLWKMGSDGCGNMVGQSPEASGDTEGAAPGDMPGLDSTDALCVVQYAGRMYEAVPEPYAGAPDAETAAGELLAQAQTDGGEAVELHAVTGFEGEALLAGRFADGWRYLLFCNYVYGADSGENGAEADKTAYGMETLLALYGVESAEDIAAVETTDWNRKRVTGGTEDRAQIEAFYDAWSGLQGFGEEEYQRRVFANGTEEEQQELSVALADDLTVVRIRLENGLSIWLNCHPTFGYFDQNMVHFELPEAVRSMVVALEQGELG